jgi:hypothetical protein
MDIGVVIPTHPARVDNGMTARAVQSVLAQTLRPAELHIPIDLRGEGAWGTRDRGLQAVRAPWVAFLDSDDEFMPHHLETLARCAEESDADYVYSYYQVRNSYGHDIDCDPLGHFGKVFDPADPIQTTIVTLVRTELAQKVGFHEPSAGEMIHGQRGGEDWFFTLDCVRLGAKIVHVPERTWWWVHHGYNTSGLPNQGDARRA